MLIVGTGTTELEPAMLARERHRRKGTKGEEELEEGQVRKDPDPDPTASTCD
jgi:hypothetical protein